MPPLLGFILVQIIQVLIWIVVARVILSWFVQDRSHPLMALLCRLTDPVLEPLGRHLNFGGLDLSPIAVLMILTAAQRLVATLIIQTG